MFSVLSVKILTNWIIICKLYPQNWRVLEQVFLQEVDQELLGWNMICQILNLTLWYVIPSCFLLKTYQIVQKVIVLFREKGEQIECWFGHLGIAQWLKFFRTTGYFNFGYLQGETGRGTLGSSLLHKNSNPSDIFFFCYGTTSSEKFGKIGQHLGE